jgi:hypothetical protein
MSHKKGLIQKYGVSCDARSDSSCTRPLYKQRKVVVVFFRSNEKENTLSTKIQCSRRTILD